MIHVAIIGYGYWGPNLVRNFSDVPECRVDTVCDARADRLALVRRRYPGVTTTSDAEAIFADPHIDAVIIATPVSSHAPLALRALQSGKHVFVEKPLAASSQDVMRLIDEAERRHQVLQVDHTFVYSAAVRKLRDLVDRSLGSLYYYDSVRVNLGLFQHDVNVIWDLAVHDLSIMDYVVAAQPVAVATSGIRHLPGRPEDLAYLTLYYDQPLIAHVHVNWLAPVKIRRTLVAGTERMVVYDDLEPSEKIKVYDRGVTVDDTPESRHNLLVGYRTGDMTAPQLEVTEPLKVEAAHFLDCVEHQKRPLTDGHAGLRVVRLLEAASRSIADRGRPIELQPERCVA